MFSVIQLHFRKEHKPNLPLQTVSIPHTPASTYKQQLLQFTNTLDSLFFEFNIIKSTNTIRNDTSKTTHIINTVNIYIPIFNFSNSSIIKHISSIIKLNTYVLL